MSKQSDFHPFSCSNTLQGVLWRGWFWCRVTEALFYAYQITDGSYRGQDGLDCGAKSSDSILK